MQYIRLLKKISKEWASWSFICAKYTLISDSIDALHFVVLVLNVLAYFKDEKKTRESQKANLINLEIFSIENGYCSILLQ